MTNTGKKLVSLLVLAFTMITLSVLTYHKGTERVRRLDLSTSVITTDTKMNAAYTRSAQEVNETLDLDASAHSSSNGVLSQEDIGNVKKMLIFAGHQRSCHSIVGSIIDAHPNVIMAPKFNPFVKYVNSSEELPAKEKLFQYFYDAAQRSMRANGIRNKDSKGYTLTVDGLYQGMFKDKVDVIGSIGANSKIYSQNPEEFHTLFNIMHKEVGVPIYVIRVIRNPYDIIATASLYEYYDHPEVLDLKKQQSEGKLKSRVHVDEQLERFSGHYFRLLNGSEGVISLGDHHFDISCEGLIDNPKQMIMDICDFLQLECSEDYVTKCAAKVFPSKSTTRKIVEWPSDILEYIETSAKEFPYLKEYIKEGTY